MTNQLNPSERSIAGALRGAMFALLLLSPAMLSPAMAVAQDEIGDVGIPEDQAVEIGRQAIDSWSDYEWYDDQADDVRPISIRVKKESAQYTPPPATNTGATGGNWFQNLFQLFDIWVVLMWVVIIAVLAMVMYLIVRSVVRREASANSADDATVEDEDEENDLARVEDLPVPVRKPVSSFLDEARRLYDEGRYGEAIVYLYGHQLLELDRHHWIRLMKGKTNRQYLRELPRANPMRRMLERTMVVFEDAFFGDHDIARDRFDHCWSTLDKFHGLVRQGAL